MKSYKFELGKSGETAEFSLSDEKGLCIKVSQNGETYALYLGDGIFLDKKYHDGYTYQKALPFCKAFFTNAPTEMKGNVFEISVNPLNVLTGKCIEDIIITNRFTMCNDRCAIIQETFYTLNKKIYDASHRVGYIDVSENEFLTASNKSGDIVTKIESLPRNIAHNKEIVLKNETKRMSVQGGLIHLNNNILDAHTSSFRYNDDLSYYNEENPIFTTYTFGDASVEFPQKEMTPKASPELMKITSGTLDISLVCKENTVAFWDGKEERAFISMLFKNLATKEEIFIDTLSLWQKVKTTFEKDTTKIILKNPENGLMKDISLIIYAYSIEDENRIEWEVELENKSTQYSLLWCTYPRFYKTTGESFDLFAPEFSGTVIKEFNQSDNYESGAYPSGFAYPMPYYALYRSEEVRNDSIYYAVHDENGSLKELYAASSQNGDIRFTSRYFAHNYGKPANSNKLPGKAIWQMFKGDWFDATEIYRKFVQTKCDWYTDIKKKKTPLWMQEIPFWVMDWVPYDPKSGEILPTNLRSNKSTGDDDDDWYKNPIKLRKALGVPIGYHVYNWHQIPFNNDYPHFMPAKKSFIEALPLLRKNGIRVMPYINALLWDNQDKGDENFEFEEFGRPGAVKTEDGDVMLLTYESRKKNGELVELSPMCPSYKLWADKLTSLITKMFDELDVDAIYLDQIAARCPHLCMDETHSHSVGGGSWWQKEYRKLLSQLNDAKPLDKAFTTESNAEVYGADIDGFLSWKWSASINDVPAFMRIYGSSVCVFGRSTNGEVKEHTLYWKYHLAKAFLCGQQLGWINSDFVNDRKRLEFVKKLVNFRYENKEFFNASVPLRPPVTEASDEHCFFSRLAMNHIGFMNSPYICAGGLSNGNKRMLLIVNVCENYLTDIVTWNDSEYQLFDKDYTVLGDGSIEMLEKGKMKCSVKGDSFLCVMWDCKEN